MERTIRICNVSATIGKYLGAVQAYQLYQRCLIHQVGYNPKLEAQMVSFNPSVEQKSPDRVDALVYAITHALVNQIAGQARAYTGPGIRKPKYI